MKGLCPPACEKALTFSLKSVSSPSAEDGAIPEAIYLACGNFPLTEGLEEDEFDLLDPFPNLAKLPGNIGPMPCIWSLSPSLSSWLSPASLPLKNTPAWVEAVQRDDSAPVDSERLKGPTREDTEDVREWAVWGVGLVRGGVVVNEESGGY